MADSQTTDAPVCVHNSGADLLARFGHLGPEAFMVAARLDSEPPAGSVTIDWIRGFLHIGATRAARVLNELKAVGLLAVARVRDALSGHLHGQRAHWTGPTRQPGQTESTPAQATQVEETGRPASPPPSPPTPPPAVTTRQDTDEQRAYTLLRSLGEVDPRLAFRPRDLKGLIPHVVARFDAGDSETEVRATLTANLPGKNQRIGAGLLHWRLTSHKRDTPSKPGRDKGPHRKGGNKGKGKNAPDPQPKVDPLVECADCGRPSRQLRPGTLCADCRAEHASTV